MYQLIKDIAQRSYEAAAKRGQDVSCVKCLTKMYDELADVLLVAATWTHSAKLAHGDGYNSERNFDTILAASAVHFITERLNNSRREIAIFTAIVYLKLRYNELRKD